MVIIDDVSITLELDRFPPSVNHAYYFVKKGNHTIKVKTKECKEFIDYIHNLIPEKYTIIEENGINPETGKKIHKSVEREFKPFDANVGINILVTMGDNRKRDLDNMLKILLDSLNDKVYKDDSQISYIEMRKRLGEKHKIKIKVFILRGHEDIMKKCPDCGFTFKRDNMTAKEDFKTKEFLGYFCQGCF